MRESISKPEDYYNSLFAGEGALLQKSRAAAEALGLRRISLGDLELKILQTVISLHGPKKFVEVGTLTGSSGLAILAGLPEGAEFWTCEKEPVHAEKAQPLLIEAAQEKNQKVHLILGDAEKELLKIENQAPFDGIFIDGNKAAYGNYLAWAEKNLRPGGLIIADNIYLGGTVYGDSNDRFSAKQIAVMRDFNRRLAQSELFETMHVPTREGLSVSIKKL